MTMNIKITMKSGKDFELTEVEGSLEAFQMVMNKEKFARFGPLIVNTSEVESITRD
jgi:hypothetical protein